MAAILNLVDIYDQKTKTFTQRLGLNKGEDWRRKITLYQDVAHTLPVDLTGYEAAAQLKVYATDASAAGVFDCIFDTDRTTGIIWLYISKEALSAIPTKGRVYSEKTALVWDMEIGPIGGDRIRLYNGTAELSPEVTT
jgi:hypothetical protein